MYRGRGEGGYTRGEVGIRGRWVHQKEGAGILEGGVGGYLYPPLVHGTETWDTNPTLIPWY